MEKLHKIKEASRLKTSFWFRYPAGRSSNFFAHIEAMNSGGFGRSLAKFFRGRIPSTTGWATLVVGTTYLRFRIAAIEENSCRFLYHRFVTCKRLCWKEGSENNPQSVQIHDELEKQCGKFKPDWSVWWTEKNDKAFCAELLKKYWSVIKDENEAWSKVDDASRKYILPGSAGSIL